MKTAISLPDELFRRAEQLAKRMRVSRSELYQRALAAFLERHSDEKVTEALNAVYSADPAETHLDPVLEQMQSHSVFEEDW
ncbi:MAG: ribbon-helix-helix protein, CopG family [Candidatus Eisenbacteria bacterium]|uniref:Ribbon-helix-helix protein, CopG family n=1 Tax=Eiseniibacteriota bacterium TaxID=2212470 RepID=A0A7Y2H1U9_UNCEI|nr:ribbon-helix-helix protein, CopG family [Candidatus Eisenbacteria bacterium]